MIKILTTNESISTKVEFEGMDDKDISIEYLVTLQRLALSYSRCRRIDYHQGFAELVELAAKTNDDFLELIAEQEDAND